MSKITKYMQMTNQLLVSYEYNKWDVIQEYFNTSENETADLDYPLMQHCPVLVWQTYKDVDNNRLYKDPMLIDTFLESDKAGVSFNKYLAKNDRYNTGISSIAFRNLSGTEYYRLGIFDSYSNVNNTALITTKNYKDILDNLVKDQSGMSYDKENRIQTYFKDSDDETPVFFGYNTGNQDKLFYNKVRIYILSGYVFSQSEGFCLKAKAKQRPKEYNLYGEDYIENLDQYATLMSFVFNKAEIREKVKWLPNPFYMSSRYYDRYIDIWMPDPFYLAIKLERMSNDKKANIEKIMKIDRSKDNRVTAFLTQDEEGYDIVDPLAVNNNYVFPYNSIETLCALMNVSINNDIIFEFSPILSENYDENNRGWIGHRLYSLDLNLGSPISKLEKECTFMLEQTATGYIKPVSNSDYFNCKIIQDPNTGTIYYSPRFGVPDKKTGDIPILNKNVMDRINSGLINMYNYGLYDNDYEDIDEFENTYGDEASKWVVLNELIVIYYYENIVNYEVIRRSSTYTNTVDYSQASNEYTFYNSINEAELFGVTSYRPIIKPIDGYTCKSISFMYNCHLVNRMNGAEVIRTASLSITDPETIYTELPRKIKLDNLHTWKVYNRIWNDEVPSEYNFVDNTNLLSGTTENEGEFAVSYYESASIVVRSEESTYPQGKYNLRLYTTAHNYKFNLMEIRKNTNEVVHMSLSPVGCTYLLRFNLSDGSKVDINPTNSDNMNIALGQLEYRISETNAPLILSRGGAGSSFNIVCRSNTGDSNVYQGVFSAY